MILLQSLFSKALLLILLAVLSVTQAHRERARSSDNGTQVSVAGEASTDIKAQVTSLVNAIRSNSDSLARAIGKLKRAADAPPCLECMNEATASLAAAEANQKQVDTLGASSDVITAWQRRVVECKTAFDQEKKRVQTLCTSPNVPVCKDFCQTADGRSYCGTLTTQQSAAYSAADPQGSKESRAQVSTSSARVDCASTGSSPVCDNFCDSSDTQCASICQNQQIRGTTMCLNYRRRTCGGSQPDAECDALCSGGFAKSPSCTNYINRSCARNPNGPLCKSLVSQISKCANSPNDADCKDVCSSNRDLCASFCASKSNQDTQLCKNWCTQNPLSDGCKSFCDGKSNDADCTKICSNSQLADDPICNGYLQRTCQAKFDATLCTPYCLSRPADSTCVQACSSSTSLTFCSTTCKSPTSGCYTTYCNAFPSSEACKSTPASRPDRQFNGARSEIAPKASASPSATPTAAPVPSPPPPPVRSQVAATQFVNNTQPNNSTARDSANEVRRVEMMEAAQRAQQMSQGTTAGSATKSTSNRNNGRKNVEGETTSDQSSKNSAASAPSASVPETNGPTGDTQKDPNTAASHQIVKASDGKSEPVTESPLIGTFTSEQYRMELQSDAVSNADLPFTLFITCGLWLLIQ